MHHSYSRPGRAARAGLAGLALALGAAGASAALLGSDTLASFNADSSGLGSQTLVDFESAVPATLGFGGSTAVGLAPSVRNQPGLWNPSGTGFLGVEDAGNLDQFSAGDTLTITSSSALRAFGLYAVAGSDVIEGDLTLSVGGLTVSNGPQASALTDGAGSYAYFLGAVASTATDAFSSVTLTSNGGFFFVFSVDDLHFTLAEPVSPVPEPSSAALALLAAGALLATRRRRSTR